MVRGHAYHEHTTTWDWNDAIIMHMCALTAKFYEMHMLANLLGWSLATNTGSNNLWMDMVNLVRLRHLSQIT